MSRSEAEDAGGRLPVKDDNEAVVHFNRRTLCFFSCGNDKARSPLFSVEGETFLVEIQQDEYIGTGGKCQAI